jgi:hypothetical protein
LPTHRAVSPGSKGEDERRGMKLAIMQPYFLPYIGYFQLIANADAFVIYDNIKYTKKGWINRNRRLQNGADAIFSLPLKKASDSLDVVERELSPDFDRAALLNQFRGSYARAPYFSEVFPLLERIVRHDETNLFRYIHHSVVELCAHLGIGTQIITSSAVDIDHDLKAQDKVIALCCALGADTYVNPGGGSDLYDRADFAAQGIRLEFIRSLPFEYPQLGDSFVPGLSIVDVLMFNPLEAVRKRLASGYELL